YAPYHVIPTQGNNVHVRGVCGEILSAIAQSMKTNYSVSFPNDSFWGLRKPDGNWTGVLGMLQRDESDLALSVINPTSQKTEVAVATETILPIELMILAGRLSRHQSNISGTVQIFSWEAWTCFLCGMVLSAMIWTVSDHVHFRLHRGGERTEFHVLSTLQDHLWSFIESVCLEASPSTPRHVSARIVVATFWLAVIILTTVFAGQMKAMMMIKEESGRIDNMKDLSLRPQMKPYTVAGSAGVSSVRDSKDPSYQKVWHMMQRYKSYQPPAVVLSDGTMREVMHGQAVLIMSRAALAARATVACTNSTAGEYYVGKEAMFNFNSVFYLNKRMPLARQQAINNRRAVFHAVHTILWLRDSGLVAKWWEDSSGNWEGCGQAISDGRLSFSDFTDLIKLWLVMLAVSSCVLLAELV
ncbi:unnamed protein product, partial [Ixodes hexagonus]